MRIHNWFRTIAGALALSAAADTASAQDFGAPGPGMAPPGYGPPYSAAPGTLYPQGVPQGFDPWPQISPFGMGNLDQDTLLNSNGLWFRDLIYKDRNFYGGIDAVYSFSKGEGNTLIGAPTLPLDPDTNGLLGFFPQPQPGGPVTGTLTNGQVPGAVYIGDEVYPYPFYRLVAGVPTSTERNDLFPIRKQNVLGDLDSAGLQVRWGFDDADGVGLMLSGFWLTPNSQVLQMGQDSINGIPIDPFITANSLGYFLNPHNGALPTNNGLRYDVISPIPFASVLGAIGATQKYDILYRIERRQEVAGTNLAYYMNPFFKSPGVMLRPYLGARYMYVNESFGFRGIDSGFTYDLQGVTGTTGTTTVPSFRPVPATLVQVYQQFEATLNSTVQTHLAGPELGLRYDLGAGDGFKIWGATTLGLMANYSNLSLNGNNIGEVLATETLYGINMLNEDARFRTKTNHSRVSPMFEQTLAMDARIFEALPYVNEIPILNTAIFHFGYTFSAVAQMNRPLDVVNWNGFPLTPTLNNNTQTFLLHKFNFGLEWKY